MQVVKHDNLLIHKLLYDMEYLYTLLSEKPNTSENTKLVDYVFDKSLQNIQHTFNDYANCEYDFIFSDKHYKPLKVTKHNDNMIVCFSGGKDSLATALHYKEKGYNVYLYHLRGINKCYPKEYEIAEKLAKKLGLPIIIQKVSLSGNHDYTEHPMKNMIIANLALSYAINNNLGYNIAFGNYYTSSLDADPFEVCGGDDIEMWKMYDKIISTIIPDFKMYIPLQNIQDSMKCLTQNVDLIPYISSCIGTYRFTKYYRQQNESKYKIQLLPNRCGSCWKCAYEYIYLSDKNILDYNEEYYKHCLQALKRTLKTETGITYTLDEVWEHYFFYDKEESKYYGKCR